jgi:hypothetical protein
MWTFLDSPITTQGGVGLTSHPEPSSENTIKSKTGSNGDVAARMEAMAQQREKEFGGVARK